MAQIHVSKDPSDKTPVACVYAPLTRCIVLGWFGLGSKVKILGVDKNLLLCPRNSGMSKKAVEGINSGKGLLSYNALFEPEK